MPSRIYLHAEIAALVKMKDWDKAYRMVVTRFDSTGKPALAKPCPICQEFIGKTPIKKVEHT